LSPSSRKSHITNHDNPIDPRPRPKNEKLGGDAGRNRKYNMTEVLTPASSPVQPAPKSATEIAEQILGRIDWMTPTEGYCDCPGQNRHSNKSSRRDCAVYLDHTPTLHCVHHSCENIITATNKKLRDAILRGKPAEARRITAEDKARKRERDDSERVRLRAAKALPQVLKEFAWPYQQIVASSPTSITGNEPEHWKLLLQKFETNDVVWIGDKFDSGRSEHAKHFKPAGEWLKHRAAPAPFICPVAFKNTSCARSNDNLVARRFLVVESDTLSRDAAGAVFRWLHEGCDLKLVAIVDTAGKSLHGWFEFEEDLLDDLKLVLPAFQCDPKLFTASQPVRLPGALRDGMAGKYQKLVYLSPKASHV